VAAMGGGHRIGHSDRSVGDHYSKPAKGNGNWRKTGGQSEQGRRRQQEEYSESGYHRKDPTRRRNEAWVGTTDLCNNNN